MSCRKLRMIIQTFRVVRFGVGCSDENGSGESNLLLDMEWHEAVNNGRLTTVESRQPPTVISNCQMKSSSKVYNWQCAQQQWTGWTVAKAATATATWTMTTCICINNATTMKPSAVVISSVYAGLLG